MRKVERKGSNCGSSYVRLFDGDGIDLYVSARFAIETQLHGLESTFPATEFRYGDGQFDLLTVTGSLRGS